MKKNIYLKLIMVVLLLINLFNFQAEKKVSASSKIYQVPVQLWHAENSGRLSMGNNALASIAQVEENAKGATYTVEFIPMHFMNLKGHLLSMSVYSGPLFAGGLSQASVISSYQDTDLSGGVSTFPALLQFYRPAQKEDKIGVSVSVDAMNEIIGGDASQKAILKFNWKAASLISGSEEEASSEETKVAEKNSEENKIVENTVEEKNQTSQEEKSDDEEKDSDEEKQKEETKTEFTKKQVADFFKNDVKTKEVGLYKIDITAQYLNPLTGVTADGGTKNIEIGQGMSQGVISPINNNSGNLEEAIKNQKSGGEKRWSKAQLQRTKDGKLYATVRIHLINWVTRNKEQGPFIKVLQENGEYKLVEVKETNLHIEQYKDSYADYTFEVPRENFSAMVQMFVEPMNRPVRFFVEVNPNTIQKGGVDGMKAIEEKNNNIYYIVVGVFAIIILLLAYVLRSKKKNIGKE
ncbi:heme-binding Shp domain-containing protein [Gemella sp. zg-1178]|uniref:heme-binding Shp domain-containing protein n=1 Tax=Gemella sp. zg-1178 TaxID=2840372 RepID=UPI001C044E34|nr:heme-binding Shp domain-containing protein [Gemella sp. zg-1178]MBU0279270.1 hypothetical protein [Gemella sp. zg-1178]